MTNGFVILHTSFQWLTRTILVHFQVSSVDNFGILAYVQALIADNFVISAHIQALVADDFGIFNTLGKTNTIQGLISRPSGSLLATLPTVSQIH